MPPAVVETGPDRGWSTKGVDGVRRGGWFRADERRRGLRRGRVGTGHCPSGADLLGELGEGVQLCRPVGDDFNLDVFVHGDGSVDLDHPIDAWTARSPDAADRVSSRLVTAPGRAPFRHPTSSRDEDR